MKRALLLLLVVACAKKEQPAPPPGSPIEPAPIAKTATRPDGAPPETQPHQGIWSIPPRGVVLWLVGDDAKAEFGGSLQTWTNEFLPTARATADRPEMQPSVVTNTINQHSVVRFNGINNIMETSVDISPQRMENATVFAVFSSRTDSGAGKVYTDDARGAGICSPGQYCVFAGKTSNDFKLDLNTVYVTDEVFTRSEVAAFANGKLTLDKAPVELVEASPKMRIGAGWQGDIAEIIVYSRTLGDLERMQVEDYLGKKYGVTIPRQ
ncbi:MAG TPA: hypothetical protein VJ853_12850 [Thermoanaerobaculia bacterium]|nr:hypothetical protein [Thermoanaerobaculia bacterium]